ncbi:hypothetical protein [Candidatus Methanomassiliicoccus intestinalis]|uniref:hypothetical protein n=1 Tax=Candidatus Methanomassiliicoccus intestinalis TaxID=1406512 RepID=UPI0037DC9AFD
MNLSKRDKELLNKYKECKTLSEGEDSKGIDELSSIGLIRCGFDTATKTRTAAVTKFGQEVILNE